MRSLTQAELAQLLGISPSTVGMYEQNRRKPDFKTLIKISEIFGVDVDYLLRDQTNTETTDINDLLGDIRRQLLSQEIVHNGRRLSVKDIDNVMHAARVSFYLTLENSEGR